MILQLFKTTNTILEKHGPSYIPGTPHSGELVHMARRNDMHLEALEP